jgi:hypothetical protein
METTHKPLDLLDIKFCTTKITDKPTSLICIISLLDEAIKYGDGAKFEIVLGQTQNNCV